jgi:hypothetical protein
MTAKQFICPPQQAAAGVRYFLNSLKPRPSAPVMFRSGRSDGTARPR